LHTTGGHSHFFGNAFRADCRLCNQQSQDCPSGFIISEFFYELSRIFYDLFYELALIVRRAGSIFILALCLRLNGFEKVCLIR
jgi:hypothetical protein